MQAYRVETTVQPDGSLVVRDLPLQAGEAVEVIVLIRPPRVATNNRYPLRGTPITYQDPTEPIVESDWEAAQGSSSTLTSGSGGSMTIRNS